LTLGRLVKTTAVAGIGTHPVEEERARAQVKDSRSCRRPDSLLRTHQVPEMRSASVRERDAGDAQLHKQDLYPQKLVLGALR
jgi:hypothetical protein